MGTMKKQNNDVRAMSATALHPVSDGSCDDGAEDDDANEIEKSLWRNFTAKIKVLKPQDQKALKNFWRSLVLPSQGNYAESNVHLPSQYAANLQSCKCCPYGYHIDLQFVRYCEALANAKPTAEELKRRTRRRSRISMEFMLGLETLFDQWDAALDKEQHNQHHQRQQRQQRHDILIEENERATPDCFLQRSPSFVTSTPLRRYQRSSSVPRFTYARPESPFATNSSTCSSYRGTDSDITCLPAYGPGNNKSTNNNNDDNDNDNDIDDNDNDNKKLINYNLQLMNTRNDTQAFLQDALNDVCSDFERTLKRASMKRSKAHHNRYNNNNHYMNDNNNDNNDNDDNHHNNNDWSKIEFLHSPTNFDHLDSSIGDGHKLPITRNRNGTEIGIETIPGKVTDIEAGQQFYIYGNPLPFQQKLSPGERQYESYIKATVAANAKSPIEDILILSKGPIPTPPPRRHLPTSKLINSSQTTNDSNDQLIQFSITGTDTGTGTGTAGTGTAGTGIGTATAAIMKTSVSTKAPVIPVTTTADPTALFNIREQMALSLKRMKDLEEQVKIIPDLKNELIQLREEKQRLQHLIKRRDEELQRNKELLRFSATPSPIQSPKYPSPVQFQPQRVSPIALESMGSRLRSPSLTENPLKIGNILKRDVGTICPKAITRDIGIGDNIPIIQQQQQQQHKTYRDQASNTLNINSIILPINQTKLVSAPESVLGTVTDNTFTKINVEEEIKVSMQEYEEQCKWEMKRIVRDRYVQTDTERPVEKCSVAIMVQPSRRDAFINCKPEMRSIGSSYDRYFMNHDENHEGKEKKNVSLKLLDIMVGKRSNTFSLGDDEKLNLKRKTIGTQSIPPTIVQSIGCQTSSIRHNVEVQHKPDMQNSSTQSTLDTVNRNTDTNDLFRLERTQTRIDEISRPEQVVTVTQSDVDNGGGGNGLKESDSLKIYVNASCNTDSKYYRDIGINVGDRKTAVLHASSNTDIVHKRDVGCGDVVKPHISIACADNYCDSCKDAVKNLAKDFSKSVALASPTHSTKSNTDSKIPRPKQLTSSSPNMSPLRRSIHRQNTYTVTPPATPSPLMEKKRIFSSGGTEKIIEARSLNTEKQNVKREQTNSKTGKDDQYQHHLQRLTYDLTQVGDDDLVVREEKRVSISWSRDNSPAPTKMTGDDTKIEGASSSSLNEPERTQTKYIPSKDMITALKIINNSLVKKLGAVPTSSATLKSSKAIIQQEWFRLTNNEEANPHEIKDYLEYFENISVPLLEYCVNIADNNGNTAMHYAVSHGNFNVISVLLDSKVCNVNRLNNAGYTCVMLVSLTKLTKPKHHTIVERLFQMANINIKAKKHSQTALMLAVSHGNLEMVKLLIDNGADVNIQDDDGSTALMCAAEHGRGDIVKHLLSHTQCDSLIKDMDGSTAFKIAWQAGHREIGMLLYLHEQMMLSKMAQQNAENATTK